MLQGKKGVWLKLPVDLAEFVPLAVKVQNFFHILGPNQSCHVLVGTINKIRSFSEDFTHGLSELCLQEGFKYHHAEESYLMMTYWIPDEPNMLPANASHQVGVGGFVINDQMEVNHMRTVLLIRWELVSEKLCVSEF